MNLHLLPQRWSALAAIAAFAAAWTVGAINDVPVEDIALRALIAAAAFWVLGFIAGRIFVNVLAQAVEEQLRNAQQDTKSTSSPAQRR